MRYNGGTGEAGSERPRREITVLGVLTIVLLVGLALVVILFVGTLWLQGVLYSEPTEQLYWRVPAAAAVLTAFLAFFCFLAYRSSAGYDTPFRFSTTEDQEFTEFDAVPHGRPPIHYKKDPLGNKYKDGSNQPWSRTAGNVIIEEIVVKEDAGDGTMRESRFKADLTPEGHFKSDPRYVDESGRVMTETYLGHISHQRWGTFALNLLLNLIHFGLWFVCLWLLLRFQWPHALGLSVPLWAAVTLVLMPMLIDRAHEAAAEKPKPAPQSAQRIIRANNLSNLANVLGG